MREVGMRPATREEIQAGEYKVQTIKGKTGREDIVAVPTGLKAMAIGSGETSQTAYYMPDTRGGRATYQQNAPKELEDKLKNKGLIDFAKRLQDEIDRMTLTPLELIEKEGNRILEEAGLTRKERQAKTKEKLASIPELVEKWKDLKARDYWQKEEEEENKGWLKRNETNAKYYAELELMEEENANKRLKIQADLRDKMLDLDVTQGIKTEIEAYQEKRAEERKVLEGELLMAESKERLSRETHQYIAGMDQETDKLKKQTEAVKDNVDAFDKSTEIQKKRLQVQQRQEVMGGMGFYNTGFIAFQIEQMDIFIKKAKKIGVQEVDIQKWKNEQIRQLTIQDYEFRIQQSDDWLEGVTLGLDKMVLEMRKAGEIGADAFREMIDGLKTSFEDFFFDFLTGKMKSFEDYWQGFCNAINRALAKALAESTVNTILDISKGGGSWFTSLFSSVFGGTSTGYGTAAGAGGGEVVEDVGYWHTGKGPYEDPWMKSMVPSLIFENAPRYHGGKSYVAPDEEPVIIRKDESILTPAQMKAIGKSDINISVPISIQGPVQNAMVSELRTEIEDSVKRVIKRFM
jgi:hypothetical protein